MSDSSYAAATRHKKPYSTTGRPYNLEIIDDTWASDTLTDDEVNCDAQEAAIASYFLDEGDFLDVDAVVVSISAGRYSGGGGHGGHSGHSGGHGGGGTANAMERRRREEGRWNDLALDMFNSMNGAGVVNHVIGNPNNTGGNGGSARSGGNGAGTGAGGNDRAGQGGATTPGTGGSRS